MEETARAAQKDDQGQSTTVDRKPVRKDEPEGQSATKIRPLKGVYPYTQSGSFLPWKDS